MLDVAGRALREVAPHVAHDLGHVGVVVIRQLGALLAENVEDAGAGWVTSGSLVLALLARPACRRRRRPAVENSSGSFLDAPSHSAPCYHAAPG
jgi:hypothetical protein